MTKILIINAYTWYEKGDAAITLLQFACPTGLLSVIINKCPQIWAAMIAHNLIRVNATVKS